MNRTNLIGDVRAEQDHQLLDKAFYQTPDFLTLLETDHRKIVVGRRGTGKSALFYRLEGHFKKTPKTTLVSIAPSDTEMIGFRHFVSLFGSKLSLLRAASSLAWQYAIINEFFTALTANYKVRTLEGMSEVMAAAEQWRRSGPTVTERMWRVLEKRVDKTHPEEKRVASLAYNLGIDRLRSMASECAITSKHSVHILVDRLDEGYEHDEFGLTSINGLLYALSVLCHSIPSFHGIAFVRDNILRGIQRYDPDYSRNTEGDVLRLHWDDYHLFNLVCNRLRVVFGIEEEKNLRVWNQVAKHGLEGNDGFKSCLRMTLYRPRDVILLLNKAFYSALSHERKHIIIDDVGLSAKEISTSRLQDLFNEYGMIFPGLDRLIECFANSSARRSLETVSGSLQKVLTETGLPSAVAQQFALVGTPMEAIRFLCSIGFLGLWHSSSRTFIFCHDGKQPDIVITPDTEFLIHPCYWIALNATEKELSANEAQEINDEYVAVHSETPEIRSHRIGQLMSRLDSIPVGLPGASDFEQWCCDAVRVLFASSLTNVQLHPNRNATSRRDVVARNVSQSGFWRRILDDYEVRQVVFEAKNFAADLGSDEYRQMLGYLCGEYGRLGFIITRSETAELERDKELRWAKEIYFQHDRRVIVKLTANQLKTWLSKIRSPQKHDAPEKAIGGLLDRYVRMYLVI